MIAGLPYRHRGVGFATGSARGLASGVAFALEYERSGGALLKDAAYGATVSKWRAAQE